MTEDSCKNCRWFYRTTLLNKARCSHDDNIANPEDGDDWCELFEKAKEGDNVWMID